jgi:glycyl-tRNA synthetase beta chain
MTEVTFDDLLIEIGCEELPPRALDDLREALFSAVSAALEKDNLDFDKSASKAFSTPRRLALLFSAVPSRQPDQVQERRGPALSAAFDAEGQATGAATGFARSVGKEVSELDTLKTDKGEWLYARMHVAGKPVADLIYPALEQAVKQLPVPRPMRWSDHDFAFVRPVHWLVVLHGQSVLEGELLGQAAGSTTRGHRIHAPGPHKIPAAGKYLDVLEKAFVLADQEQRQSRIHQAVLALEQDARIDQSLLREVNNLVEWPVAISCAFEEAFLSVPHQALVASMQDHQKFFPVLEASGTGNITNRFVAIANLESLQPDAVREGYERVIRPRLADARSSRTQSNHWRRSSMAWTRLSFRTRSDQLGTKEDGYSLYRRRLRIFYLSSQPCANAPHNSPSATL